MSTLIADDAVEARRLTEHACPSRRPFRDDALVSTDSLTTRSERRALTEPAVTVTLR
ncbi:hypothetical protein BURKHO8Y_10101 [Burkholderia sp. 8Y]|nr:hypothetical protein BURKHO8Y_10101 [Burkholderia sp. 8Y]